MVADGLGIAPARIRIHQGDTDIVARGVGTFGSRSLAVGGSALLRAVDTLIDKARQLAAEHLEAASADLEFVRGRFVVAGTDHAIAITELARRFAAVAAAPATHLPGGSDVALAADGTFQPLEPTYPNGCHVCEVEIDPETGATKVVRYTAVADFGNEINPMLVDGQVHGA